MKYILILILISWYSMGCGSNTEEPHQPDYIPAPTPKVERPTPQTSSKPPLSDNKKSKEIEKQQKIKQDKLLKFLRKWSKIELKEFEDFFTSVQVVEPNKLIFQFNAEFSKYNLDAQERETIPIMKIQMSTALEQQGLPATWADDVQIHFRKK